MHCRLFSIKRNLHNFNLQRCIFRLQSNFPGNQLNISENEKITESDGIGCEKGPIKISTKIQQKLPAREPLIKNFFIGKVDKKLIPFPEVITRENLTKLQDEISAVRNYFDGLNVDINKMEQTRCIGKDLQSELKSLGLYGQNIPQHFGGSGYFCSEGLIAAEPATNSADISNIISSHNVVVDVLLKYGSDYLKERYLSKLADGSIIATDAIYEPTVPEGDIFTTKAIYDDIGKNWILSGEKSYVINSKTAGLFLVLAQTSKLNIAGGIIPSVTIFLVDSLAQGVKTSNKPLFTLGCQGSEHGVISFDKVVLSNDLIVGDVNEGNDIAIYLLQCQRIRMSLLNLGLTKNLINKMTEFCTKEKQAGVLLRDMEIVRHTLSKLVCNAYSLESMIYYTAGLIDEFDNQDVSMEVAITKLHSLNTLWSTSSSPLNFMGPPCLLSGSLTESTLRNAAQLYISGESRDSLSLLISLMGLQHAGMNSHETVKKERNPLLHPTYILKKVLQSHTLDHPKLKWEIHEELHPSLQLAANWLEESIARLEMSATTLLVRYGAEIIERHIDIDRLTKMTVSIYSMLTSLSRSSRSYCIGLRHSDYEMQIASVICYHAKERVKALAIEIDVGPYGNNDRNHGKIVKQLLKNQEYFFEHPITFNF